MGFLFSKRPLQAPGIRDLSIGGQQNATNIKLSTGTFTTGTSITLGAYFQTTAAVIANRVVKLTSGGGVKHTTGSSGRKILGVALAGATGAGSTVAVAVHGIVYLQVSTAAVKRGAYLRATSGAASTGSQLGGTVRSSTNNTQNGLGIALTSAAAGAGARKILAYLNPMGRVSTAA